MRILPDEHGQQITPPRRQSAYNRLLYGFSNYFGISFRGYTAVCFGVATLPVAVHSLRRLGSVESVTVKNHASFPDRRDFSVTSRQSPPMQHDRRLRTPSPVSTGALHRVRDTRTAGIITHDNSSRAICAHVTPIGQRWRCRFKQADLCPKIR